MIILKLISFDFLIPLLEMSVKFVYDLYRRLHLPIVYYYLFGFQFILEFKYEHIYTFFLNVLQL